MSLSELQFAYRGLTVGAGTVYRLYEIEGLEDLDVRDGDRDAPRDDGGIPGLHLAAQKTFILRFRVTAGSDAVLESLLAPFYEAFTVRPDGEEEFTFRLPGQSERMVRARPLRRVRPRTRMLAAGNRAEIPVAMKMTDPRIYSAEVHQALVPILGVGFPGIDAPLNAPINLAAGVQSEAVVVNGGDQPAYPLCRFQYLTGGTGDFDGIILTNLTNGSVLTITAVVTAGQILVADMDAYVRKAADNLIVYIDTASRFGDWEHPREPFHLDPGSNTLTFEVTGAVPTDDAVCSVTWRDTFI